MFVQKGQQMGRHDFAKGILTEKQTVQYRKCQEEFSIPCSTKKDKKQTKESPPPLVSSYLTQLTIAVAATDKYFSSHPQLTHGGRVRQHNGGVIGTTTHTHWVQMHAHTTTHDTGTTTHHQTTHLVLRFGRPTHVDTAVFGTTSSHVQYTHHTASMVSTPWFAGHVTGSACTVATTATAPATAPATATATATAPVATPVAACQVQH
jgi:hypothetical protein